MLMTILAFPPTRREPPGTPNSDGRHADLARRGVPRPPRVT